MLVASIINRIIQLIAHSESQSLRRGRRIEHRETSDELNQLPDFQRLYPAVRLELPHELAPEHICHIIVQGLYAVGFIGPRVQVALRLLYCWLVAEDCFGRIG